MSDLNATALAEAMARLERGGPQVSIVPLGPSVLAQACQNLLDEVHGLRESLNALGRLLFSGLYITKQVVSLEEIDEWRSEVKDAIIKAGLNE